MLSSVNSMSARHVLPFTCALYCLRSPHFRLFAPCIMVTCSFEDGNVTLIQCHHCLQVVVLSYHVGRRFDAALDIAPTALVGREVRVYWDDDDAWYLGTVSGFSSDDHMHEVPAVAHALMLATLEVLQLASFNVSPVLLSQRGSDCIFELLCCGVRSQIKRGVHT